MLPKRQIKSSMKVARYLRDYILTHNVCALITSRELLYAKWLKKQTAVKLVFHLHSSPFYEFLDVEEKKSQNRWTKIVYDCGLQWLLIQFYQQKYLRVYKWADAYGVLCKAYSQVLIDRLKLSSENKLWILPNSIGTTGPIVHTKQKVIVYVGRLSHRDKRVDRLLRIWKLAQPRTVLHGR